MAANPNSIEGLQANETFLVTAVADATLGRQGEMVGFAKHQFNSKAYEKLGRDIETIQKAGLTSKRNNLSKALADGNASPELQANAREEALAAMKKLTPNESRAGLDTLDNAQVLAAIKDMVQTTNQEMEDKSLQRKNLNTLYNLSAELYGEDAGQAPPDRALLARTVASSQVDQLLGTRCVAEEIFGLDNDNRVIGVSIQGDGEGLTSTFVGEDGIKRDCLLEVNLADSAIQRGLSDLEAVDYITGQIDRHCGNILIDPATKKVTGIDNDMAFPEISREEMFAGKGEFTGKAVDGMPRHMHQDTAHKILSLNPEVLRATLAQMDTPGSVSRLSDSAIQSACGRLVQLQNELKKPAGGVIKVVEEFDQDTYSAAVATQEAEALKYAGMGSIDEILEEWPSHLDKCAKTSYVGVAVLQSKRYEKAMQTDPDKFGVRPASKAGPAARVAEEALHAQQLELAVQALAQDPAAMGAVCGAQAQQEAQALHQNIADLKEKIAHYDKETAGLEQGRAGSLVRSLASGGSSGRKEFYADKKVAAMQQIGDLRRQLESLAEGAMTEEFKAGLRQDAYQTVLKASVPTDLAPPPPVVANNEVAVENEVAPQNAAVPAAFHAPPKDLAPAPPDQDNLANGASQSKSAKTKIPIKDKDAGEGLKEDSGVVEVTVGHPRLDQETIDKAVAKTLKSEKIEPGGGTDYHALASTVHDSIHPPTQQLKADTAVIEAQLIDTHEIQPLNQRIKQVEQKIAELEQTPGVEPDDAQIEAQKAELDDLYEDLDTWEARMDSLKVSMAAESPKNRLAAINAAQTVENLALAEEPDRPAGLSFDAGTKLHDANPRQEYELQVGAANAAKNLIGKVPDAGVDPSRLKDAISQGYGKAYEYEGPERLNGEGEVQRVKAANERSITGPEKDRLAAEMQPTIDQVNTLQASITPLENAQAAQAAEIRKDLQANPASIEDPQTRQDLQLAQEKLDTASARVAHCEAQLAKLQAPGRLDRMKATVQHGGVDKARQHYESEKKAAVQTRSEARAGVNGALDKATNAALQQNPEGKYRATQIGGLKAAQARLLQNFHDQKQAQAASIKPDRVKGQANTLNARPVDPHAPIDVKSAMKAGAKAETNEQTLANAEKRQERNEHLKPTVQDMLKNPGADHAAGGQGQKAGEASLRASWKPGASPAQPRNASAPQLKK